jgi:hypothetical protein
MAQALQKHQRRLVGAAFSHGTREQLARGAQVARLVRLDSGVEELLGLALLFGKRTARPFDVGAGASVPTLEKLNAGPDVDRLLVAALEVVIQPRQQQLFDQRLTIRVGRGALVGWRSAQRFRHLLLLREALFQLRRLSGTHRRGTAPAAIIGQNPALVNELQRSDARAGMVQAPRCRSSSACRTSARDGAATSSSRSSEP